MRFVARWNRWLTYDGALWRHDKTLFGFDQVREVCRRAAADQMSAAEDTHKVQKFAATIASANTVAAVHSLARADRRLAATESQWDVDPMILNTPGGVVDLKTGEIR